MESAANNGDKASSPDGLPEIKAGSLFAGTYRIIRLLGQGGMGSVYLAGDIRAGNREVALKILHGKHARTGTMSGEFSLGSLGGQSAEARFLASCEHPSILPVYDAGVDAETGFAYLTMRPCLLSGREVAHLCDNILHCPYPRTLPADDDATRPLTLRDLVKGGKALPECAVARIGIDLVEALAYMHGQSPPLIHRDIKPSNILLDAKGHAILSDFGIAKSLLVDDSDLQPFNPSTRQPFNPNGGHPSFAGTPIYAAPEQKADNSATPASDYYCLGVVLHEMLTGERPWGDIAPSKYDSKAISPRWDTLLRRLLANDPHDRLADPREILRTIRAIAEDGQCTRRRLLWGAVFAVAAALTAAVVFVSEFGNRVSGAAAKPDSQEPIPEPQTTPDDFETRASEVIRQLELLKGSPVWPMPSAAWFPSFLLPPRPENNRRHSACQVFEMRLPGGAAMQFVPFTAGPGNEHRRIAYKHAYFIEDDPEGGRDAGLLDGRSIIVSKRLLVSRTEVTREQFDDILSATNAVPLWELRGSDLTNAPAFMAATGMGSVEYGRRLSLLLNGTLTDGKPLSEYFSRTVFARRPFSIPPPQGMPAADGIRFADVERFIEKLNALCPKGCTFRLPTEAEWEAICRHLDLRRFEGESPDAVCWSRENSGGAPHPVAQKAMNVLGVYDMHGNVAEWCLDGFRPMELPAFDPLLPVPANGFHVVRGGSWADPAEECGSEVRKGAGPDATGIGFRLVLEY